MGIILLLLALAIKTVLSPFLIAYGILRCIIIGVKIGYQTNGFWGIFTGPYLAVEDWLMELALSVDQMGNVMGMHLWNDMFRKKGGYDSGDRLDTISYFLGSNKRKDTLTGAGRLTSDILGALDKDHVERLGEIEMAVKMRPTDNRTKRPRGALLYLDTEFYVLTV